MFTARESQKWFQKQAKYLQISVLLGMFIVPVLLVFAIGSTVWQGSIRELIPLAILAMVFGGALYEQIFDPDPDGDDYY